ncbi:MAG TPA: EAL domain-containing protein [Polyangiales bacterium]|nr:EAL domain-containing protein [Polyangiales bacterium]
MTEAATAKPSAPPLGARVLVVDDEQTVQQLLVRLLVASGYEVRTANNGEEALRTLERETVDLIVTDLVMPKADGMALLQSLRERAIDVPVVMITGAPTTESAMHAVRYRADAYLTKPVDPSALVAAVGRALHMRSVANLHREAYEQSNTQNARDSQMRALTTNFTNALQAIYMVYQPIISWSRKEAYGYEALVRSTEKSLPHPGALFEAAERLDRTSDLGSEIRARCGAPWNGLQADYQLFVNLHSQDLLDETLYEENAPLAPFASRVVLELTERAALDDISDIGSRITRLRTLGYRIAVDDIGAGYSGLNSLATVQPDFVKLDISLVRGLDKDAVRRRLVQLLTQLCNDLKISVVAEGVETVAERDALIDLGIDLLQGYLFARPAAPFVVPVF